MAIDKKFILPFKVINSSSVSGGYADILHTTLGQGTEITNWHRDAYGKLDETILQSPFTQQWVGGRPDRHIALNTGSDDSNNRPEAFHTEFISNGVRFYSHAYRNSPPAYWLRDGLAKRPVNIGNVRDTGLYLGNYSKGYEVLQTTGRRIANNLIVDGFEASGSLTTQFVLGENNYTLPDLTATSETIIVERFNAPGSKEESSRGALDREGEELSPNIPLPFRNIKIRQPYYRQLSQHMPQFGSGSTYKLLPDTGTTQAISIHKVNRNRLVRGGVEYFDNWFVQHAIPRTDIQYSWITASAYTTAAELGGYEHTKTLDAYEDIQFITASLTFGEIEVDNNFIQSRVKDKKTVDITTNTFSIESSLLASFSEYTNSPYSFAWTSTRMGDYPVPRTLRNNNLLSVLDKAREKQYILGGKTVTVRPQDTSTSYVEPPVTFKYYPLEHRVSVNNDINNAVSIKYSYTNYFSSYANKDLLERLSIVDDAITFYDVLQEEKERERLFYHGHSYREIVWPTEENTGLTRTRKRQAYILDQPGFDRDGYDRQLGTQRAFWRENQEDRKRSKNSEGGYRSSLGYLSTEETGSNFTQNESGVLSNNRFVTFDFNFIQDSDIDSGLFNSISLLEKSSTERETAYYSGSIYGEYITSFNQIQKIYNSINKRSYIFDLSGEFNSSFSDFYEQFNNSGESYKKSIGSLYRNTSYKFLISSFSGSSELQQNNIFSLTDDEELTINPKLKYITFVGGVELNTGSFIQNEQNFTNTIESSVSFFSNFINDTIFLDDVLYVCGNFTTIGAESIRYIAKFDENGWSSVGTLPNSVIAPAIYDSRGFKNLISSGSDIYVTTETNVSGSTILSGSILKWDGTSWDIIPDTPAMAEIETVLFSGSDMYIGGRKDGAGFGGFYKWDGISWSIVGGGLFGTVYDSILSGSDIIVVGNFPISGSTDIAKWDGASWDRIGTWHDTPKDLRSIILSGSDIIVGGIWEDPEARMDVARYSGGSWSFLGGGIPEGDIPSEDGVEALLLSGSDLYAGGNVGLYLWNGSSWSTAIPSYDIAEVKSLSISGSDIFITADSSVFEESIRIFTWDGSTVSFLSQGLDYKTFSYEYFNQTFNKTDFLFSTLDNGLLRNTEEDSGKKPFFDSYDDFINDIRGIAKDYSVIPEFRISQHMNYYIADVGGNFLARNNAFLEIDGTGDNYRSSLVENDRFDDNFVSSYLTSDLLKKEENIRQQEDCELETINLTVSGIKKLLPYNGFYPQDRTVQLANLYGEYVENKLHGGTYNISYKLELFNENLNTTLGPTALSPRSSISCVKYENKYYLATGEPLFNLVSIFSSSAENPEEWEFYAKVLNAPVSDADTKFGQKVQLLSASNGLNLFIKSVNYDDLSKDYGYILHSFSSDGTEWSDPVPLSVYASSLEITGSKADFADYFDVLLDSSGEQEKIIIAIGSPTDDYVASNNGAVFVVTGTLYNPNNSWRWSDKNLIYYSQYSERPGTGISLISCSSGYQLFFAESETDLSADKQGTLLVCTSSNARDWSTPTIIARGNNGNGLIGLNDIKAADFNGKTYIFFSEPGADIGSLSANGAVFCVTSSNNNEWPTSDSFLDKKLIYFGSLDQDRALNPNKSYSIETFIGNDNRLYYAFKKGQKNDKSQLILGYVTADGFFETSENNQIYILNEDDGYKYFSNDILSPVAAAPYSFEGYEVPIFFYSTERVRVAKNNIFTEFTLKVSGSEKYYKHAALEPFFAPGILYNTIKSGIAVDWPCATGSQTSIQPYGSNSIVNAYYPQAFEMASYSGSVVQESSYGLLRSNIDYRIPFERLIFPDDAFVAKKFQETDLVEITPIEALSPESDIVRFIDKNYIYGGYEPYISPVDFSDIDNTGPKRFSVPFVYRKQSSADSGLYSLAMSNFLAETVRFFLKDEKMITFTSEPENKWLQFDENKTYYMDIVLKKSPDLVTMEAYHSDLHPTGSNGEKMNGRYFGYPINKTDKQLWGEEEFTAEEAKLIHNDPAYAPYTPPYFEGEAIARIAFTPNSTRDYSLTEIFANSEVTNIFTGVGLGATTGSDAYNNAMPVGSSINLFGLSNPVNVTFDEATRRRVIQNTDTQNQWVISPYMETPVLDFSSQALVAYENSYSKTSGFGRGMWSGYGQVPAGDKSINIELKESFPTADQTTTGSLLQQVGFIAQSKPVGTLADAKIISEAIAIIPYVEQEIDGETLEILEGYHFIKINPGVFTTARASNREEETSVTAMIDTMQKYVMPPQLNFLQYDSVKPFITYLVEFEHTLDQQDLADIWQGLMPKISYTAEMENVSINHPAGPNEFFHGKPLPPNLRWMVFKVKRKAEADYFKVTADTSDDARFQFNKIIGREQGTDVYSYNWPYDFFSLVEFAKVELKLDYKKKE